MTETATALARATRELEAAGAETPRLDAEVLLALALGTTRAGLLARLREPLPAEAEARFDAVVGRRLAREPVAYIAGEREFWSLSFEVDATTLIPRPETETLVAEALASLGADACPRLLDAGTGSGCIAVALAVERRDALVTAIDTSAAALAVAARNAVRHGVAERISFLRADLRAFSPAAPFDLVVANPPYVRRRDIEALAPEVRLWEPRAALDGGDGGLDYVLALLARAPDLLAAGGAMAIEIGCDQAGEAATAAASAGFRSVRIAADLAGRPRVIVAREFERTTLARRTSATGADAIQP